MSGRDEMASKANRGTSPDGSLARLRVAALIAMLAGAAGSLGLLFHASQRRPPLLMIIFVIWVLSPFLALVFLDRISQHRSALTRATLYAVMLAVALGSVAVYAEDALRPRKAQAAFVYVMVPPVSWLLGAIVIAVAALMSGRRSRRASPK